MTTVTKIVVTGGRGPRGEKGDVGSVPVDPLEYVAADGQTTFAAPGSTGKKVDVYLNGLKLPTGDYALASEQVVLDDGCAAGDEVAIDIIGFYYDYADPSAILPQALFSHAFSYPAGSAGNKLQQFINPCDRPWQAQGDGVADDRAALAAADAVAYSAGRPLYITKRHRIGSNLTLQSDIIFIGGRLEPANATTTTCRGIVSGPCSQIFAGAGSVVGIRQVRPEWWGAVGDEDTDDQPALQAAHDCVEQSRLSRGDRPTVNCAGGVVYGLGRTLKLRPSANIDLQFIGDGAIFTGTRFQPLSTFDATDGDAAIWVEGQTDPTQQVVSLRIGGFAILPRTGSLCTKGLQIGSEAKNLIGTQQSEIFDVYVGDEFPSGFPICYYLGNFTLIDFNRCSAINRTLDGSRNVVFFCDTASSFVGDINFNSCRFTADDDSTNTKNVDYSEINVTGAQAKGHRYNDCTFYSADRGIDFSISNGGIVGDIWFNPGTQFDGFQNAVIYGHISGAGTVLDDINVNGVYFRGVNNGQVCVDLRAASSARLDAITVARCWFANLGDGARSVYIEDGTNVHVDFNMHTECSNATGELIGLTGVTSFTCMGNTLSQVTAITVQHLVTIGLGTDHGSVAFNAAGGHATGTTILNLSAGANLTLTPNQ
jgi:hypothetical protein